MTNKNQMFAFLAGEVSPAFYGRLDLQKYSLSLAEVENFFVDYHGGLMNRPGTEFIGAINAAEHRLVRFRSKDADLVLLFTSLKCRVIKNGAFVLTTGYVGGTAAAGVITAANTLVVGQLVAVRNTSGFFAYVEVTAASAGNFTVTSPFGDIVPNGSVTWAPVYEFATPFSTDLPKVKFSQDLNTIVATIDTLLPRFFTRVADNNWTVSTFNNVLPAAPTGLSGVASGAGSACVGFAVTAVVDGVESASSTVLVTLSIVNYATTTGHFTLSWSAVAGAERYNVYRSLVFPTATYPTGAQLSYIGYTTGLSFVDRNITPDGVKTIPSPINYFASSNNPSVYTRFQQRGVYAGLKNEPLTIVGSIAEDKGKFSVSFPPIATDSYSYTIDSESERPIKHLLSLRYGLMVFTDDQITQLRGAGENATVSAISAIADPQGNVSVSDLDPIAINLDVLFMTKLGSELNQMVYTEYTNSFKMQDILVLSSHLFGDTKLPTRMVWAAEPHKQLHFVREDGERVALTYERNLDVYGWSRYTTDGLYKDIVVAKENGYDITYQTVSRIVGNAEALFIEREVPRGDTDFNKMKFVDAGIYATNLAAPSTMTLVCSGDPTDINAPWSYFTGSLLSGGVGSIVYAAGGIFRVTDTGITGFTHDLEVISLPTAKIFKRQNSAKFGPGAWAVYNAVDKVRNLWWLEGKKVSVLLDGDVISNITVTGGVVNFPREGGFYAIGLPYVCEAKTLPLSLPNYVLGGFPLSLRGLALRPLRTRGLKVGTSFDDMEEIPVDANGPWGTPIPTSSDFVSLDLWGAGGWDIEAQMCFQQTYPLPATIVGFTFDLDVGE